MMHSKPLAPSDLGKFLAGLPPLSLDSGPVVAGGAARRAWCNQHWMAADVDVFFRDEQQRRRWQAQFEKIIGVRDRPSLDDFENMFTSKESSGYLSISTPNADTYHVPYLGHVIKVQLINTRFSNSVSELWNDFDFDVSCFATDGHTVVASPEALESLTTRKLTPRNSTVKKNLTLRVLKYQIYGFEASDELLLEAADLLVNGESDWQTNY